MIAPVTDAVLDEWIETAAHHGGMATDVSDAVYTWLGALLDSDVSPFTRWTCNDDNCPGRPEWDKAVSEFYNRVGEKLSNDLDDQFRRVMRKELKTFIANHPDLPLKSFGEPATVPASGD